MAEKIVSPAPNHTGCPLVGISRGYREDIASM